MNELVAERHIVAEGETPEYMTDALSYSFYESTDPDHADDPRMVVEWEYKGGGFEHGRIQRNSFTIPVEYLKKEGITDENLRKIIFRDHVIREESNYDRHVLEIFLGYYDSDEKMQIRSYTDYTWETHKIGTIFTLQNGSRYIVIDDDLVLRKAAIRIVVNEMQDDPDSYIKYIKWAWVPTDFDAKVILKADPSTAVKQSFDAMKELDGLMDLYKTINRKYWDLRNNLSDKNVVEPLRERILKYESDLTEIDNKIKLAKEEVDLLQDKMNDELDSYTDTMLEDPEAYFDKVRNADPGFFERTFRQNKNDILGNAAEKFVDESPYGWAGVLMPDKIVHEVKTRSYTTVAHGWVIEV